MTLPSGPTRRIVVVVVAAMLVVIGLRLFASLENAMLGAGAGARLNALAGASSSARS